MHRRRFLQAVAAGGALTVAGCSEGGSNPFEEGDGTAVEDGDGSDGFGGSDGDDGDGGGETTAGGGETTAGDGGMVTESGGSDGSGTDGDGTATDSGGDGTGSGDDGTATATEAGGDGTETTVTNLDNPTIGGLDPTFQPSFRFSADWSDYNQVSGDASMEGAWHRGDFKGEFTAQGETVTLFSVSDTTYVVVDGNCTELDSYPTSGADTEEWVSTEETEQRFQDLFEREADGQTTIDGETMYVFEISAAEAGTEAAVTYYLSANTGLLRRVETQGVVLEYWDWGNVPPIEAPC